jgi:negative regulator of flagellin synthesis FlgM
MSDIAPVSGPSFERIEPLTSPARPGPAGGSARTSRAADRVDISGHARLLNRLAALPIRQDLVDRVRQQIADGTYESEEKLEQAIAALAEDLDS